MNLEFSSYLRARFLSWTPDALFHAELIQHPMHLKKRIAQRFTSVKLGNVDFMARAPEEVVDEQRERREEAEQRSAKFAQALERLKRAG